MKRSSGIRHLMRHCRLSSGTKQNIWNLIRSILSQKANADRCAGQKWKTCKAIHRTMDKNKACGIDKVTREKYEQNLEENLENLVKKWKLAVTDQILREEFIFSRMQKAKWDHLEYSVMKIKWWTAQSHNRSWSRFMNQSFTMRALDSDQTETVIRR